MHVANPDLGPLKSTNLGFRIEPKQNIRSAHRYQKPNSVAYLSHSQNEILFLKCIFVFFSWIFNQPILVVIEQILEELQTPLQSRNHLLILYAVSVLKNHRFSSFCQAGIMENHSVGIVHY